VDAEPAADLLVRIWREVLVEDRPGVEIDGRPHPVSRTARQGLRTVGFDLHRLPIEGIEQNPETTSRWAKLAQSGQRIMQFRARGRYIANVCEGKLTRYPAWTSAGLPT
jgi:hypothetical protein